MVADRDSDADTDTDVRSRDADGDREAAAESDPRFLPLEAYGAIGNDNRCALVGRDGSIDWLCFPHVESPSVCAAILDPDDGGRFAVTPADEYTASFGYVDRTNVLRTTYETTGGAATVTDFMPVCGDEPSREGHQRAVYRKLEGIDGTVEFDVVFEPRFDYARADTSIERDGDADGTTLVATGDGDADPLSLHCDDLGFDIERAGEAGADDDGDGAADRARATIDLEEDETRWLRLQYGRVERPSDEDAARALDATIDYWRDWLDDCESDGRGIFDVEEDWADALERSALVLKLLIHDGTGSIPAAPTTSLPEAIGDDLNWDYRYNWIRDAKFTVQALYNVGQAEEAQRYFEWFRGIGYEEPSDVQPLYGLHGETGIGEETLDHLSGYRDSRPVRVGNAAADQRQLDIYGTIIQGIYETLRYENGLSDDDWGSICALADHVCEVWEERDASIWEFRDEPRHYVHSKLLCWVALDRACQLADDYDRAAPRDRWEREREAIREAILERGYSESAGSFVQHFDTDEALDATALLLPLYDFLPPDDERVRNTIDAVLDELATDDGLVRRFANSELRPDEPGGFFLCSFWLVDALVLSDRLDEAESVFSDVLEYTTPLGLLSEMGRPDGLLLGNFPQAFSHIGLLNSAVYLASAREDVEEFPPEELEGASAPLFRRHGS